MDSLLCSFPVGIIQSNAYHYAGCIAENGASLGHCVGFLDGTKIFMPRPGGLPANPESCYSRHKRIPYMVYLSIITSNGLVPYMYGPEERRRHNLALYLESNLADIMQDLQLTNDEQFYVYGDSCFVIKLSMQVGYFKLGTSKRNYVRHCNELCLGGCRMVV